MQTLVIRIAHIHLERAVSVVEWCLLVIALGMYTYFIVTSVINVVLREELIVSIEQEEARIGQLEAHYLERSANLTGELAADMGLVELNEVAYVHVEDGKLLSRRQ